MGLANFDIDKHANPEYLKQEIASIKKRLEELSVKGDLSVEDKAEFRELESKWKNFEDDLKHLGE